MLLIYSFSLIINKKGELDIELPVVVYLDAAGEVVSHEVYKGSIPGNVLKIRWQDRIVEQK